jgi:hypothetical protein
MERQVAEAHRMVSTPRSTLDAAHALERTCLRDRLAAGWGWGAAGGMEAWDAPDWHLLEERQRCGGAAGPMGPEGCAGPTGDNMPSLAALPVRLACHI